MNILWGCPIAAVGLFLFLSGTTKSRFIVYRLRSPGRRCSGASVFTASIRLPESLWLLLEFFSLLA